MKPAIALSLLLCIFFSSCKKEEIAHLSGLYKTDTKVIPGHIVLYTNTGIITDTQYIHVFLTRTSVTSYFNFTYLPEPIIYTIAVDFKANKRARIFWGTLDTLEAEIIEQTNNRILLASIDSIEILSNGTPSNRCEKLQQLIQTVNPVINCTPFGICKRRKIILLLNYQDGQLSIPLLTDQVSFSWSCFYSRLDHFNSLKTDIPAQLMAGDTVVVQPKNLAMIKQY